LGKTNDNGTSLDNNQIVKKTRETNKGTVSSDKPSVIYVNRLKKKRDENV
jgi:hypothetical protein